MRSRASISISIEGKTLALVGESGCGKSTLARILTLIDAQTSGELTIRGNPVNIAKKKSVRRHASTDSDRLPEPLWLAQSAPEGGSRS